MHLSVRPPLWQGDGNLLAATVGRRGQKPFPHLGTPGIEIDQVVAIGREVQRIALERNDNLASHPCPLLPEGGKSKAHRSHRSLADKEMLIVHHQRLLLHSKAGVVDTQKVVVRRAVPFPSSTAHAHPQCLSHGRSQLRHGGKKSPVALLPFRLRIVHTLRP